MGKTKIEWTERTWSPITGCTPVSEGCQNCYARRMARRLAGRCGYPEYPHHFDVTLHPERLEEPLRRRKPTMYFVCSMSDLFHEDVPTPFIADVWKAMYYAEQHTFQVLTKRPQRMLETFSAFARERVLPNVWLGVTVENQAAADERIPLLLRTPAAVRFVSCEPLLGPVDLTAIPYHGDVLYYLNVLEGRYSSVPHNHGNIFAHGLGNLYPLNWVIVGGESGPGARPMHPDWARSLVRQCQMADVPIFVKQMGSHWAKQHGGTKGNNMKHWPRDLQIRDFPRV